MNLLLLCTGNSCRSQIAEGWGKSPGGAWLNVESAGIEAQGKNPRAIAVMAEAEVDISGQESTKLTDEMIKRSDYVVTVCGNADERCPTLPAGVRKEHWPLADPARANGTEEEIMNAFRATRDEVQRRMNELIERLKQEVKKAS